MNAVPADLTPNDCTASKSGSESAAGDKHPSDVVAPELPILGSNAIDRSLATPLDVRDQQTLLNELFRAPDPVPLPTKDTTPEPAVAHVWKARLFRLAKALLALALAAALGWQPLLRLFETASTEAVINARLITLRSPIDGEIAVIGPPLVVGADLRPDRPFVKVVDSRVDRSRLGDLSRSVLDLRDQVSALDQKRARLIALRGALLTQIEAFRSGRIRQLESRVGELNAEIASAEAELLDTNATLDRVSKLSSMGAQTLATLDHAQRDAKVAKARLDALRSRIAGANVELDSARAGVFVGDSYNDTPQSAQRAHELDIQIADVEAQIAEVRARLNNKLKERDDEERRFNSLSAAELSTPTHGRVWEVLVAPGEQVRRNQDLLRVLDCEGAIVTAAVSESVYDSLHTGDAANFKLRGDNVVHAGHVIGLYGLAAVPGNFAIQQTALAREPYHVSIEVPDLKSALDCDVGRTGKVTFGTASLETQ